MRLRGVDFRGAGQIESLIGKTLVSIASTVEDDEKDDEIYFTAESGEVWRMYHEQDCCEGVYVESVAGDFADLIGSPILEAEEATSDERPADTAEPPYLDDSATWTFYKIGTAKGRVTIRWCGTSNGYYSESVDFERIGAE